MKQTQQFYDGLATDYHHIFDDWDAWVQYQSDTLKPFLDKLTVPDGAMILDTTCGIGTQAIALALVGYRLDAHDLSPESIEQARINAQRYTTNHPITFGVADLLVTPQHPKQYDVVLAMDNPIAHFLTDDALHTAFTTMKAHLKPDGVFLTSIRDYDEMAPQRPKQSRISVTDHDNIRRIVFQVWDWDETASSYESEMFVLTQSENGWETKSHKASFRAWRRDEVTRIMTSLGLRDIQWHMPEDTKFYQPVVSARR